MDSTELGVLISNLLPVKNMILRPADIFEKHKGVVILRKIL